MGIVPRVGGDSVGVRPIGTQLDNHLLASVPYAKCGAMPDDKPVGLGVVDTGASRIG